MLIIVKQKLPLLFLGEGWGEVKSAAKSENPVHPIKSKNPDSKKTRPL
jgi:hypothetical protein